MIIDKKANLKEVLDSKKDNLINGINFQLFAAKDDVKGDDTDDKQDTPTDDNGGNDSDDDKTFTQDQVNDIVQDRLNRDREKNKADTRKAIDDAIADAKAKWDKDKDFQRSLADMNDDDKAAALQQKQLDDLKAKENELRQRELLIDTNEMLVDKDIPKEFASILIGNDEETTKENVETFAELTKAYIDEEISKGVQKTLSTRTPGGSGGVVGEEKGATGRKLAQQGQSKSKDHNYFE